MPTLWPSKRLMGYHGVRDGEETLLSMVRLCRIKIPPSDALDMSQSPHLTIGNVAQLIFLYDLSKDI